MIGSIGSNYAASVTGGKRSGTVSGQPSAFASILQSTSLPSAVVTKSSLPVTTQILDDSFFKQAYTTDQATRGQMWADAAKSVSISQGLPEGQYDFSRMTPAQALVVMNDHIVNKGDPDNETMSINMPLLDEQGYQSASWQIPMNYVDTAKSALAFASAGGYVETAESYRKALAFMTRLGSSVSKTNPAEAVPRPIDQGLRLSSFV